MEWLIYLPAAGVAALSLTVLLLIIINKDNVHLTVPLQNIYATSENENEEGSDEEEEDDNENEGDAENDNNNLEVLIQILARHKL